MSTERESQGWQRTLRFAGRAWGVKTSRGARCGPGPNVFADDPRNVWVDQDGRLHLRITRRDGAWQCVEVAALVPMGHGTYAFRVEDPGELDPNIVLGLFLYAGAHREIDIELGRFGVAHDPTNAQFTVQPLGDGTPAFASRFWLDARDGRVTHEIVWRGDEVSFRSIRTGSGDVISTASTAETIPPDAPGDQLRARINLWLHEGRPPANGEECAVIVAGFAFTPTSEL
jgi:hypothetical protein